MDLDNRNGQYFFKADNYYFGKQLEDEKYERVHLHNASTPYYEDNEYIFWDGLPYIVTEIAEQKGTTPVGETFNLT